jgi:hypothetical protein
MIHRNHRPARQYPGEHHGSRPGGVHRLTWAANQVNAPVAAPPVRYGSIESPADHWYSRPQRPLQPQLLGMGRHRADHRHRHRNRHQISHLPS